MSGIFLFCLAGFKMMAQPAPLVVLLESQLKQGILYDAWVEFSDKGITSAAQRQDLIKKLEERFNARALARRKIKRTFPGLFDEKDFPMAAAYLLAVKKTGARIRVRSRWLNGISILANKNQILKVKKLKFVKEVTDFHQHTLRLQQKSPIRTVENWINFMGAHIVKSANWALTGCTRPGIRAKELSSLLLIAVSSFPIPLSIIRIIRCR